MQLEVADVPQQMALSLGNEGHSNTRNDHLYRDLDGARCGPCPDSNTKSARKRVALEALESMYAALRRRTEAGGKGDSPRGEVKDEGVEERIEGGEMGGQQE